MAVSAIAAVGSVAGGQEEMVEVVQATKVVGASKRGISEAEAVVAAEAAAAAAAAQQDDDGEGSGARRGAVAVAKRARRGGVEYGPL